jgi:c(7)-type cytochrome triheme protein
MGCSELSSSACRLNKLFLGIAVVLLWLTAGGCVQPKLTKAEAVLKSGLDAEGHPIALRVLPRTGVGDIDWVAGLKEGTLRPKNSLATTDQPDGPVLNLDIVFNIGEAYPVPNPVFPHAPHTLWLNCNNCHPAIFIMKQGANPISMDRIIKGEYCGRCHGVVAFPFTDCFRCHSRPKTTHVAP